MEKFNISTIQPDLFYTVAEVAYACEVSKPTVYRWIESNKIQVNESPYPMRGRGGKNLIQGAEFLELLKWRRQEIKNNKAFKAGQI